MGLYLMQVAYTSSAVKALVGKPQARKDVVEKVLASVGGKLVSFHFCFGDYDVVLIADVPGNDAAAAVALATSATGAIAKFHTTVLMTPDEGVSAMTKAGKVSYTPPA